MTIGGALSDLNILLKADDIPCYYKPSIKAVMDTIALNNSEKPTSSTTKDYLGVDAISRQAIKGYTDYILSHGMGKKKSFDYIKKFVANLPSVTPQEPTTKNNLAVEHHKQNIQTYAHDFGVSEEQAETELRVTKKRQKVRDK